MSAKSLALRLARAFALLFALFVLGYLVVDAEHRANPRGGGDAQPRGADAPGEDVEHAPGPVWPPASAGDPTSETLEPFLIDPDAAAGDPPFLWSSKSAPVRFRSPESDFGERTLLHSSKSGVFEFPLPEPSGAPAETDPETGSVD